MAHPRNNKAVEANAYAKDCPAAAVLKRTRGAANYESETPRADVLVGARARG